MDALQIDSILRRDPYVGKLNYLGVFPSDEIPKEAIDGYPCCAVVNTKPHNHPGMHWVSFVKDEKNFGTYFSSYGDPPVNFEEMSIVLQSCDEWQFNDVQLQTFFSAVCGQYCVFFLTHFARGFSLDSVIELINDSGDTFSNDALIFSYINSRYPDQLGRSSGNPPLLAGDFILADTENL